MEVHQHTHTPDPESHRGRKKWGHYFWEFLMLFFAVFCGSYAEYQLEHYIEHKREKQYMKSLVEDLRKDTVGLAGNINFWEGLAHKIDSTRRFIKSADSEAQREKVYEMAAMLIDFDDFIYNDRTIDQLRNAGNFRLIRKSTVADTLISYDSFIRSQLREQESTLLKVLLNILSLQNELFDSDQIEVKFKILKGESPGPDTLSADYKFANQPEKIFKYYNDLFLYRAGIRYLISSEKGLKKYAESILELVRKEYHLE